MLVRKAMVGWAYSRAVKNDQMETPIIRYASIFALGMLRLRQEMTANTAETPAVANKAMIIKSSTQFIALFLSLVQVILACSRGDQFTNNLQSPIILARLTEHFEYDKNNSKYNALSCYGAIDAT